MAEEEEGTWAHHEEGDRVEIEALKVLSGRTYTVEAECNYTCEIRTDEGRSDGSHDVRELNVDAFAVEVFEKDGDLDFDDLPEAERDEIEAAVEAVIKTKLGERLHMDFVFERGPFRRRGAA